MGSQFDRRSFLKSSVGSITIATAFSRFLERSAEGSSAKASTGYGKLAPVKDETTGLELLQLPDGFRYLSFGWTGDKMSDGLPTPSAHDGMAVIAENEGVVTLCRNHERTSDRGAFSETLSPYDPAGGAGCTNLTFDANEGRWLHAKPSLVGTLRNCAGGPTPWGSWLSCEETVLGPGDELSKGKKGKLQETHGWIFEVPAEGQKNPVALKDMGRFVHEAVAVDPETGIVYETEDRGTSGFYRFLPNEKGHLAKGGNLQMMKVQGAGDVRKGQSVHKSYHTSWVDIEDPERAHSPGTTDSLGVFQQGKAQGGTTFARLEGCWYSQGRIYINSTSGGDRKSGQVWVYTPQEETLTLIFESPGKEILDSPDNLAVSPRGGLIHCEDGDYTPQRLHGMTPDGEPFLFAANNIRLNKQRNGFKGDFRGQEWAGASFSSDGRWLFVNIQTPGITFAITGPWSEGGL